MSLSSRLDEGQVSDLLNRLYTRFDDLAHYHGIYKLETIGDAYLAVTNIAGDQVCSFNSELNAMGDNLLFTGG